MCFRRLAAVAISLISLALLAGCGGAPPRQQRARVEVVLLAGGGARVDLYAAGRLRSDADVRALARRIAGALFPGAEGIRVRTGKDRGAPFARAEIDRAYRTGRRPFLRIDTSGAARELAARGFDDTAMKLRLPPVPATVRPDISGNQLWHLREGDPAPVIGIGMRPEPARWAGVMALPLLGALGVALAFFVRRRALAAPRPGSPSPPPSWRFRWARDATAPTSASQACSAGRPWTWRPPRRSRHCPSACPPPCCSAP
ncbi:hypothetical protein ACFQY7_22565 [Actinomadura luteofluorescens]|uniref:hypothetical protein n=1 Tax=Actinomadura luteofluorescens TaxID=46163 RepID=UPI0036458B6F